MLVMLSGYTPVSMTTPFTVPVDRFRAWRSGRGIKVAKKAQD
jgi:hypothetical protein